MFQKAFKKVMQAGTNGIVKKVEPEGEQEEAKSIFNFEGFVQPQTSKVLLASNLPHNQDPLSLFKLFSIYGNVIRVKIIT